MPAATIELPQEIYELAEREAHARNIGLSDFVAQAVQKSATARPAWKDVPWMKTAGALADLHDETIRIQRLIDEEFGLPREQREREALTQ
ncbi:hypothetical protein AXK11_05420 [Cephaloticoccus primus]|uniref:Uncharacterized protein n=1 Tax=Cephaloticoccus primus TaxID=1548207 RepID=A0A139SMM2_9BACT|nr:hypothetical protein [Cephaloticoccus primus]KXU35785.1 hypothetical protein AXK11_05420 [Cephaloticoccus primus]